jgi:hypothetical protein
VAPGVFEEEAPTDGERAAPFFPPPHTVAVYLAKQQVASPESRIMSPEWRGQHPIEPLSDDFESSLRRHQSTKRTLLNLHYTAQL